MIKLGPVEVDVIRNRNVRLAQRALDALNQRLNARKCRIIQGQRILMHLVQ
jgi:hypothetical protein